MGFKTNNCTSVSSSETAYGTLHYASLILLVVAYLQPEHLNGFDFYYSLLSANIFLQDECTAIELTNKKQR